MYLGRLRRFRASRCFAIAAGLLVAATTARADEATDVNAGLRSLLAEKVVTTASKTAETGTNAPATATIMTADDIRRYGLHTVDEAIAFLSLGGFSSDNLQNPEIGARGVAIPGDSGAHILVLVDGHAVNEPLYGAANLGRGFGIPLELVDHIELVLGPGSVLYGSNAMLGVINIVTKRARSYAGVHAIGETEVGKSYRGAATFGWSGRLFDAPLQVVGGAEYFAQDGPTFRFGPQIGDDLLTGMPARFSRVGEPTGVWGGLATDSHYAYIPSGYLRSTWGRFTLSLQAVSFKRAAPYGSNYVNPSGISDFNDPDAYQIDRGLRGDLSYRAQLTPNLAFSVRAYVDSTDRRSYVDTSTVAACRFRVLTCRKANEALSQWGGSELQGTLDWWNDGRAVTLLGFDGRQRIARGRRDILDYDTGAPLRSSTSVIDTTSPIFAGYLQQTFQLSSWLGLNGGARVDHDPRFTSVLSPRLAATSSVWEGGTLKVAYAEAFRGPTLFESEGAVNGDPLNRLLSAPPLRPERVRSVEGSMEQKFGANRFLFGVYRSWWTNMVEQYFLSLPEKNQLVATGQLDLTYGFSPVSQYRNIASIDNFGFNASWEGILSGRLRYGINATGAIAERIDDATGHSRPLTVAPHFYGNTRLAYDLDGGLPTLALAAQFSGSRIADRAFDGDFTSFPVAPPQLQLRATASGAVPFVKGLSYRASANYAFAERGPYVVGPVQQFIGYARSAELVPVDRFRVTVGLEYVIFE